MIVELGIGLDTPMGRVIKLKNKENFGQTMGLGEMETLWLSNLPHPSLNN